MRTDISGKLTFRELLKRVRETCLEAYDHQDLPFERLVEEIAPKRDPNLQPLFQVLLVLNTPDSGDEQNVNRSKVTAATTGSVGASAVGGMIYYDLTLFLSENETGLSGALHFNTELFDSETAEGMVEHFQALLNAIIDQPDNELSSISILPEQEKQLLLNEWIEEDSSPEQCIQHLVELQADRIPQTPAIIFGKDKLTYSELDEKANQLAHYLYGKGINKETVVGVFMERGLEAIVSILGILKAGGVYLPLDPNLPQQRLALLISDASPSAILSTTSLSYSIHEYANDLEVIYVDDPEIFLEKKSTDRPNIEVDPAQMAYIVYTSGSTGRPKGVMVEHRSLCYTINGQIPRFGLIQPDVQQEIITT